MRPFEKLSVGSQGMATCWKSFSLCARISTECGLASRNPYIQGPKKTIFHLFFLDFLGAGEAVLAADLITAWKTLPGRLH